MVINGLWGRTALLKETCQPRKGHRGKNKGFQSEGVLMLSANDNTSSMCGNLLLFYTHTGYVPGHALWLQTPLYSAWPRYTSRSCTCIVNLFCFYICEIYTVYQGWVTGGPRAVYSPRCLLVRPAGLYYTDDFNKPYFCYISLNVNQWISKKLMHYTNLNI